MTVKTFQSLIAGQDGRPPTNLIVPKRVESVSSMQDWSAQDGHGMLVTAGVSTVLTDLVNITGSGVLQFAGLVHVSSSNVVGAHFRIVLDGVTVMDEASFGDALNSGGDEMICLVGHAFGAGATLTSMNVTYEPLPFYQSLVISAGRDSGGTLGLVWKRHLT